MGNLIPLFEQTSTFPFKLTMNRIAKANAAELSYEFAVAYHSKLFKKMVLKDTYLDYELLTIGGLDTVQVGASSYPKQKNYYCVLEVTVKNLQAESAKIVYIEGDDKQEDLAPIKFADATSFQQTKARVIIGVAVYDLEYEAGLVGDETKTAYVMQYVNSNLIMANMVFNGIPVIYPVPIAGGRMNSNSF